MEITKESLNTEIEFLKNNYSKLPAKEISKILNKSLSSIYNLAFKLKLKGRVNGSWSKDKFKVFTKEDVEFLKENYTKFGPKLCAKKLNKSRSSIQKAAKKLNLIANRKLMVQNNPELLQKLREHAKKTIQPINEINKIILNRIEIEILYESGKAIQEIAAIYSCSTSPIKKILKDLPKRKVSESPKHISKTQNYGEKHHSWKGGIKSVYDRFRDLSEYYSWRKEVLNREDNKCTNCTNTSNLHCHHIKTLKSLILEYCSTNNIEIKDLTREDLLNNFFYDLSNGLTLCETCHKKWHKEHGR